MKLVESIIEGIRELTGVELTEDDFASVRHDLMTVLLLVAHHKLGDLREGEAAEVLSLFDGLRKLQLRASRDDKDARLRLTTIERLIDEAKYEIPTKDIEKIAGQHTPSFLARARAIQAIEHEIFWHLEPKGKDVSEAWATLKKELGVENDVDVDFTDWLAFVKHHEPNIHQSEVQLRREPLLSNGEMRELIAGHLREGSTLESLAISIYLEQLKADGIKNKTEKSLARDLRDESKWRESNAETAGRGNLAVFNKDELPYFSFSDGWKNRKVGSGGDRKDNGEWHKEPL